MATTHTQGSPATTEFARQIPCNTVSASTPFRWVALAVEDFKAAPLISLLYGLIFSVIPAAILYATLASGTHLVILPATVAFALIGPLFAVGLYDIAWQREKGHAPTLGHSIRSVFRNPVGEWGFALVLTLVMIAWMRLATLIHALYPTIGQPSLSELLPFLAVGSVTGFVVLVAVFALSAFTPQITLERRVDLMTAIASSVNAVRQNIAAMTVWAGIILAATIFGFATSAIGFIFVMPILAYASWHAYIAVIKTQRERHYE